MFKISHSKTSPFFILSVLMVFVSLTSMAQNAVAYQGIKTVVIDAGHGGKDPGCHGAHAKEKHVCLAMALKLGAKIKATYPEINVIYTRTTDVFIGLDERAKIANRANADLFICIHANAASSAAYGTETYVLGLHKTESQQNIAERENSTIYLEEDNKETYKDFVLSADAIIARQIQLSVFLDQSISFATKLQSSFAAIGRRDRGVKQAGFIVLYKTTMPSVLIETGFLTNPQEEAFLSAEATQNKMANAMFSAFEAYKKEIDMIGGAGGNSDSPNRPTPDNSIAEENPVVFKVQIETSEKSVPLNDGKFKGENVWEYQQGGLFKYTVGDFEGDFDAANALKKEMRAKGFKHAFVVAFVEGERISLEKAIKLAQN